MLSNFIVILVNFTNPVAINIINSKIDDAIFTVSIFSMSLYHRFSFKSIFQYQTLLKKVLPAHPSFNMLFSF